MYPWENVTLKICYHNAPAATPDVGDGIIPKGLQGVIFTNVTASMILRWERVPLNTSIWGVCFAVNQTCLGQLKPVHDGVIDMAMGPIVHTDDIDAVMKTWFPTQLADLNIIAGFPNRFKTPGPFTIFSIFPVTVWILIFLSLFVLPAVSWLMSRTAHNEKMWSFGEHWSLFTEAILGESSAVRYVTHHLRLISAAWMISCMILTSFMSATLKSVMVISRPTPKVETIYDLIKLDPKKVMVGLPANTGLRQLLAGSNFKPHNKLAEIMQESHGLISPSKMEKDESLIRSIEVGKAIFILPCSYLHLFFYPPSRKKGSLGYVYCTHDRILNVHLGWVTAKNTDELHTLIYKEMERRTKWLYESPIPQMLHYEIEPPQLQDRVVKDSKNIRQPPPSPLQLKNVIAAYLIFGVTILLAFIAFVSELAASHLQI